MVTAWLACALIAAIAALSPRGNEEDHYRLVPLPCPEGLTLEVSAIALLADGRPLVATRRGEVFVVENATAPDARDVVYHRFAQGLQEPLGLLVEPDGWIYCAQRGELSRLRDRDGDDRADEIETVCDEWRLSGNYHEYNFGPVRGPEGDLWITTNKPFGDQPFGPQKWRGFALRIDAQGRMHPAVAGLRSPAGIARSPWGELFYTDNQGEWCGASKLALLEPGTFQGHPHGLDSCADPRWPYEHPGPIPDGVPMPAVGSQVSSFRLPAVWFPYDAMGRSPAGFVWDDGTGRFGPFRGQLFVADQYQASILRVSLERVEGRWQGACYPFRRGLGCGAIRVAWAEDGSLLVGETDRGWPSLGTSGRGFGLERLVWTGATPFEVLTLSARADGFHVTFTAEVEEASALDPSSYELSSYTYLLHSEYGSQQIETRALEIRSLALDPDRRGARLAVEGLREGFVHELHLDGVRSGTGQPLLHPRAYYTLVRRPPGP